MSTRRPRPFIRTVENLPGPDTAARQLSALLGAWILAGVPAVAVVGTALRDGRGLAAVALATVWATALTVAGGLILCDVRKTFGGRRRPDSGAEPSAEDLSRGFPEDFYLTKLRTVKNRARIMDTYSHLLADNVWRQEFVENLRRIVSQSDQTRIEILLLDAESAAVDRRAEALADDLSSAEYRWRVQRNLRELLALTEDLRSHGYGDRLRVRLIDSLPGITCYQCDEYMLTAICPLVRRADDAPQLWVREESPLGGFVSGTFDRLWRGAGDLESLMFCRIREVADGPRLPFVVMAERRTPYLVVDRDVADSVAAEEITVVGLPDADGTRTEQRYRARIVDKTQDPLLAARVSVAMNLKYGDIEEVDEDDEIVELIEAATVIGA